MSNADLFFIYAIIGGICFVVGIIMGFASVPGWGWAWFFAFLCGVKAAELIP